MKNPLIDDKGNRRLNKGGSWENSRFVVTQIRKRGRQNRFLGLNVQSFRLFRTVQKS